MQQEGLPFVLLKYLLKTFPLCFSRSNSARGPFIPKLLLLSRFRRVRLCDPTDGSPPGSSVPGVLQARALEWAAIAFSNACKWKVKSESEVTRLCRTLSDHMDGNLPGSSIHGILQARVLEWVPLPSPYTEAVDVKIESLGLVRSAQTLSGVQLIVWILINQNI